VGLRPLNNLIALFLLCLVPLLLSSCALFNWKPILSRAFPSIAPSDPDKGGASKTACPKPTGSPLAPPLSASDSLLEVTLPDAIVMTLANNRQFQVERLTPAVVSTAEDVQRAAFDPVARAEAERSRTRTGKSEVSQDFQASGGMSEFLPTGTTLDLLFGTEWTKTMPPSQDAENDWQAYARFSVTQALLQGAGIPVNLANLRQARLDTQISVWALTGVAETLIAELENAYWDYFLAAGQVGIYSRSLALATRLVRETRDRIELGQKARSEIYFVQAEQHAREQTLIDARSFQESNRLKLLRLMSPPSADLWNRQVKLLTKPSVPRDPVDDIANHVQVAMRMRPDLNEARLLEQRGELEIVKTRNGLLPKLDLFAMLGRTGYSSTFNRSVSDITAGSGGLDFLTRLQLEYPLLNRKAKAQYDRSVFTLAQEREAVANLVQLAQQDVLLAYVEIRRARDQMRASWATVKSQVAKRDAEIEKYRLGTSNAYRVAQTERDTVTSEISALQARIDYLKGLTQLYLAEGSLLARRGVGVVPGLF
jgi:outer membrane protein